jgi:hypothetical protein
MRFVGFLLLLSGWGLVVAALGMLSAPSAGGPRAAFALAGMAVEILGLVLTIRAHLPPKNDRIPRSLGSGIGDGNIGGGREAMR